MTLPGISDEDRYRFDLQGYLVLRGVLSALEVEALNGMIDGLGVEAPRDGAATRSFSEVLSWGRPFLDLLDHPRILPYLQDWIDPRVRLDHVYPIFARAGDPPGPPGALHGGGNMFNNISYYLAEGGRIHTSLTVVSWALTDCPPGLGGFACIPGSHKATFGRPDGCEDLAVQIPCEAGDAIIFTEALTHASFPWTAPHPRRSLLFKYCPGSAAWIFSDWPDEVLAAATPTQRRLLEPPYISNPAGVRRDVAGSETEEATAY